MTAASHMTTILMPIKVFRYRTVLGNKGAIQKHYDGFAQPAKYKSKNTIDRLNIPMILFKISSEF